MYTNQICEWWQEEDYKSIVTTKLVVYTFTILIIPTQTMWICDVKVIKKTHIHGHSEKTSIDLILFKHAHTLNMVLCMCTSHGFYWLHGTNFYTCAHNQAAANTTDHILLRRLCKNHLPYSL